MARSVLGVAHSARRSARSAAEAAGRGVRAVAADPRGLVALGFLGAAATGALVLGARKAHNTPSLTVLFTPQDDECAQDTPDAARTLDSNVDKAASQADFDGLQQNWTDAAALYLKASATCPAAQYALGRLRIEGRGYVYDPDSGARLYERAAFSGNSDAQYALACCFLHAHAARPKMNTAYNRGTAYRASRLLILALNNKNNKRALEVISDFSARHDHTAWMSATSGELRTAAKSGGAARLQLLQMLDDEAPVADISPLVKGEGGWSERRMQYLVIAILFGHLPSASETQSLVYTPETQREADANELISLFSDTLALIQAGSYTGDVAFIAEEASWLVRTLRNEKEGALEEEKLGTILSIAEEMIDHAVRNGDAGALFVKVRKLKQTEKRTDAVSAELTGLLDRGVLAGSLELLYERGIEHETRNNEAAAKKDFARAAELGHYEAMEHIRGPRPNYGVTVSPIPAALEMLEGTNIVVAVTTTPGTITTESIASDSGAVWKALGIEKAQNEGVVVSVEGDGQILYYGIGVAWPDLRKSDKEKAATTLQAAYKNIFSKTQEVSSSSALIVQPIPNALFGDLAEYAPEITAHAIMLALKDTPGAQRRRVTMCVFDSLSVVAAYDAAFKKFGSQLAFDLIPEPEENI
jgi:TPR repeat protein